MTIPLETLIEVVSYVVSGAAILAAAIPSPKAEKASKALSFVRKGPDLPLPPTTAKRFSQG